MVMIHIEKEYNYKGYECAIKKIDYTNENIDELFPAEEDFSGRKWWLSGYIFLPNFKLELKEDINNIMHGGITYEDFLNGFGITPNLTVLGFDCNHKNDGDDSTTKVEVIGDALVIERYCQHGKGKIIYNMDTVKSCSVVPLSDEDNEKMWEELEREEA